MYAIRSYYGGIAVLVTDEPRDTGNRVRRILVDLCVLEGLGVDPGRMAIDLPEEDRAIGHDRIV